MSILCNLPHAFLVTDFGAAFVLEEFTHGSEPRTGGAGHAVKRPLKKVAVGRIFRIAGWGGNVNLSILTITWQQFTLCEGLRDIDVIGVHIVLRSDSEKQTQTARVWYTTKSVFEVANAGVILFLSCDHRGRLGGLCICRIFRLCV